MNMHVIARMFLIQSQCLHQYKHRWQIKQDQKFVSVLGFEVNSNINAPKLMNKVSVAQFYNFQLICITYSLRCR